MIPRSLVPPDVRLPEQNPDAAPRRLTTLLDERTIVAANLPHNGLETHSSIPAHMPLDVLASRVVVPRDTPLTPLDPKVLRPDFDPVTPMDQRFTVPAALPVVALKSKGPVAAYELPDVVPQADVLMTGEANLSVEPIERPSADWDFVSRMGSLAAHGVLLLLVIFQSKLFPYKPPTQATVDLGRQLGLVFLPNSERTLPEARPSPTLRVNPGELRRLAPSEIPLPAPKAPEPSSPILRQTPVEPPPVLPVAPKPPQPSDNPPDFLRGPNVPAPQQQAPLIQPQQPQNNNNLILPRPSSPGRSLDQNAEEALRGGGGGSLQFGGPVPGAGGGGGGLGGPSASGGLEMLTPTEGVDFSTYLNRLLAIVKRNWVSIWPESARLGDRGRVVLQFRVMKNGTVPESEPQLIDSSTKEPLDRAALGSIRASSPFEPLPSQFSGPFIELRIYFFYNYPPNMIRTN